MADLSKFRSSVKRVFTRLGGSLTPKKFAENLSRMWQRPWIPLFVFAAVIVVEFSFDAYYLRFMGSTVSLDTFKWHGPFQATTPAVKELTARLMIEAVDAIQAVMVCWVLYVSFATIARYWPRIALCHKIALPLLIIPALTAYLILWGDFTDYVQNPFVNNSLYSALIDKAAVLTNRSDFGGPIYKYLADATHIALISMAFAAGVVVARPGENEFELSEQLKALTSLLYPCALLIVMHVAGQGISVLWPAAMLSHGSNEAIVVNKLAVAVSINNAVFYTILLIAFHIPAVHAVTSRANELPDAESLPIDKRREWLTDHELADTWGQYYLRLGTVLSPFLAGIPLTKMLTVFHG